MKQVYLSYHDIHTDCIELAKIIKKKFKPQKLILISRGGLIPGVMISHKLNIPFKPVHASTRDFPHWENYLPKSHDSKVLIVDDICDSGETFIRLSNYIKENINHECEVRFSALWWNNECDFEPHYYTRDIAKDTSPVWVFFPHENWWEGSIS